ncbi:MAG: ferrous iron transport protein B [Desulfatibacillaceae bacterium]
MSSDNTLVALAGQPNCGKSTVFNALCGTSQHVANYPGVTVDKKVGWYRQGGARWEVVDLPGTYSLTSYSPEERVARDFILHERPSVVVNVTDATNLKRSLYLTFQLTEMEAPVVLDVNMMDLAEKRGIRIDADKLRRRLGVPVVLTAMKAGRGKKELAEEIRKAAGSSMAKAARVDYGELEEGLRDIERRLQGAPGLSTQAPLRWVAIKLMENDAEARAMIEQAHPQATEFLAYLDTRRIHFEETHDEPPEVAIAQARYRVADDIARTCIVNTKEGGRTLTDRIDSVVCHKVAGPVVLIGIIWLLYYLAIVQGYNITNYTWPLLAKIRSLVEVAMPAPGFIEIPLLRAFSLWFVDSVNALLNYIPIFFILFALIAILEDSGYMPRMAFIMDRLFGRYGLHGQSTLPMVLGGIYVGGCAVPGVMSCKGIPDERSRLATILIIPLLNCLAKVPLYVLLINIYFAAHKPLAMFFISTISLLMVLPVSKLLTMTVLRDKETAPFVMEMPPYHVPSIRAVLMRAVERVWLFIRKITTIVAAVAVVIFVLLQFPGISDERMAHYEAEKQEALGAFFSAVKGTRYAGMLREDGTVMDLLNYYDAYKDARMRAKGADATAELNARFEEENTAFFAIATRGGGRDGKKVNAALRKLHRTRQLLLQDMRKERIDSSFLGRAGQALVPVTRFAGFDWKVNVALLSALAAKESSVATLGALYQPDEGETGGQTLEERMGEDAEGFTPLHALALMLFMVLYPPCLATTIAVKVQTNSVKWMLFSVAYPMALGLIVAVLVFSGGSALGVTGLQAMFLFYGAALAVTIVFGFLRNPADQQPKGVIQ